MEQIQLNDMLQQLMSDNILKQLTPQQMQGQLYGAQPNMQQPIDPMQLMMQQMLSGQGQGVNLPTGAALTGLTPEHLSNALQMKTAQDQMMQRRPSELMDMMYKGALVDQAQANAMADRAKAALPPKINYEDTPSPIQYPGINRTITNREFSDLTPAMKEYAGYVHEAKAAKKTPKEFEQWLADKEKDPLAREKAFLERPAEFDIAARLTGLRAGESAKATSQVKDFEYLNKPEFQEDLAKKFDLVDMVSDPRFPGMEKTYGYEMATKVLSVRRTNDYLEGLGWEIEKIEKKDGKIVRTLKLGNQRKEITLAY